MDIFGKIAEKIIEEQEAIIGPIAVEQAQKVKGLELNWQKHEVTISGNKTGVIESLVEQYKALFGQASVEACKQAVHTLLHDLPKNQVPTLLQ